MYMHESLSGQDSLSGQESTTHLGLLPGIWQLAADDQSAVDTAKNASTRRRLNETKGSVRF